MKVKVTIPLIKKVVVKGGMNYWFHIHTITFIPYTYHSKTGNP